MSKMALQEYELEIIVNTEMFLDEAGPDEIIDIWLNTDQDIKRIKNELAATLGRKVVKKRIRFGYYRDICH